MNKTTNKTTTTTTITTPTTTAPMVLQMLNKAWDDFLDAYEEDRPNMPSPFSIRNGFVICREITLCNFIHFDLSQSIEIDPGCSISFFAEGKKYYIDLDWIMGEETPYIKRISLLQYLYEDKTRCD